MNSTRDTLHQTIDRLSESTLAILLPVLSQVAEQKNAVKTAFLLRSIGALNRIAQTSDLAEVLTAPSDYSMLLQILETPEALSTLTKIDPKAQARVRGLLAKQQLLQAEGGWLVSEQVAEIIGITRQAVDKRRRHGKLIGLPMGQRKWVYPAWQFETGGTLPGLEAVLEHLQVRDPWMQAAFMLNGNLRLEGMSPLDALRQGQLKSVLIAAQQYGEHGAA